MSKRKQPTSPSDFGPRERLQHSPDVRYENTTTALGSPKRMRVIQQTPLDRYYKRDQITRRQYEAGQALYSLWRRAGQAQRLTANYEGNRVDGGKSAETGADAFTDYIKILKRIGRDFSEIAQWCCIEGMSAGDWAKEKSHDPKGGIVALRLCLDALGDCFGMPR